MERIPELHQNKTEDVEKLDDSNDIKLGSTAINAYQTASGLNESKESEKRHTSAVDFVQDHFPEEITSGKNFKQEPLETEEDYKRIFNTFDQKELTDGGMVKDEYKFNVCGRPFKETVGVYLHKTEAMIKSLSGEDGKNPPTDVAIYLDKSARPVSWFVNDFWSEFSDKPMPRTEHLAIDRRSLFDYFKIKLDFGEYINGHLAGWDDLPIHNVTAADVAKLQSLLENKAVILEDVRRINSGNAHEIKRPIIDEKFNIALRERKNISASERLGLNQKYNTELDGALNQNTWEAFQFASQIRALFLSEGITEEEMDRPDIIMRRESGMEGKNITIIDEVKRSGATGEIATHLISWAFPEAASVRFDVFYEAKRAGWIPNYHLQGGQMTMIPFWYDIEHDKGHGRGIGGVNERFYQQQYEKKSNNLTRAALYGAKFLGTPIDYNTEINKKSLNIREQIARLLFEYKKGNIK